MDWAGLGLIKIKQNCRPQGSNVDWTGLGLDLIEIKKR